MATQTITYGNKTDLNTTATADINKVKASDLNEIKSVVNNNASELSYLEGTVLWTNANPTSSFGAQTITLSESLDNYGSYEILFRQQTTTARIFTTGKIPVGNGTILHWETGSNFWRPTETSVSGTTITFEAGRIGSNEDNAYTIPYQVIAYK